MSKKKVTNPLYRNVSSGYYIQKIVRGGSYMYYPTRATKRNGRITVAESDEKGFRICLKRK